MSHPASFGMLLIRVMVGCVMIYHGAQKLFPEQHFGFLGGMGIEEFAKHVPDLPVKVDKTILAWAAALSEFAGGILLITGFATRIGALFIAATMGVAAWKVHGHAFSLQDNGMEYALTLAVVAGGLIFTGPGKYALDSLFFGRRKEEA